MMSSRTSSRARVRSNRAGSGTISSFGQRDDVVGTDEDVELRRVQPPGLLVEAGELHDEEEVLVVLVDLGPLVVARDVLEVELVEVRTPPPARSDRRVAARRC